MKCASCEAEMSQFDVHCRACGASVKIKSISEHLEDRGWVSQSDDDDRPMMESVHFNNRPGLSGLMSAAGGIVGALAKGAVEGTAQMADSVIWDDPNGREGWTQKNRTERAIRDSRK